MPVTQYCAILLCNPWCPCVFVANINTYCSNCSYTHGSSIIVTKYFNVTVNWQSRLMDSVQLINHFLQVFFVSLINTLTRSLFLTENQKCTQLMFVLILFSYISFDEYISCKSLYNICVPYNSFWGVVYYINASKSVHSTVHKEKIVRGDYSLP